MTNRIESLKTMLEKSPREIFLHYSLGMEYASAGSTDLALAEFRQCVELNPAYLPAYVEAGKCLRAAGKLADARQMFQTGLDLAAKQDQKHIHDFLQQQLEGLPNA